MGLGAMVFYSLALWAGVFFGEPFAFSITAWLTVAVAGIHHVLTRIYGLREE
jgi:hypothetical protein